MMSWNNYNFLNPCSNVMEMIHLIHDFVMMIIFSILFMVLFFMIMIFFDSYFEKSFFEEESLETVWTIIPFIFLFFVLFPSISLLYFMDTCIFCGLPIFINGHQWYWSYKFLDYSFDSYMINNSLIYLLETDNCLILPFKTPIRCFLYSSDVIHSWTVPSLGVKMDAIPGRVNNFCFSSKRSGIFFGQCSEICGMNHSFMPISIEFIPMNDFLIMF